MLSIVLVLSLGCQSEAGNQPDSSIALAEGARIRWGNMLMREAYLAVTPSDLALSEIEAAIMMSRKAALFEPDNADRWRLVLGLTTFAGDAMPYANEVGQEATLQLSRLCPGDQVIRLRRILQDIDRRETADDRVQAFRKFLTPEAIKAIQVPVASRLCLDLAFLEWRMGDVEGFAADLAKSLALAPAFPAAAETAAGFINERIDDPVAECELLVAAVLANPIDERLWSRLGALLLQEGAYGSAARVYQLAGQVARGKHQLAAVTDVIAVDYALALWGADRPDDAIRLLKRYVGDARLKLATLIQTYNPELSRAQCEGIAFPMPPIVATVDAAIQVDARSPDAAAAMGALIASASDQIKRTGLGDDGGPLIDGLDDKPVTQEMAQSILDVATAATLLDADPVAVTGLIDLVQTKSPLSDEAMIRFDGWRKLREGDAVGALAILAKSSSNAPALQLIRAKALSATGDIRAAAKIYYEISKSDRGSLLGIFAAKQVKAILGAAPPPSEIAGKLDGIVASIPAVMEQYLAGTEHPVSFQVEPEQMSVEPFDPIRFRLTMMNRASFPLAISQAGPIRQQVLLQPRINSVTNGGVDRLLPQIIPIDRAIELAPGESLSMVWDFGWTDVGLRIGRNPLAGGTVSVRGASNYFAEAGSFSEGPFGVEPTTQSLQVEGVRVTPAWIAAAIASAENPVTDHDLVQIGLLMYAAKPELMPAESATAAWQAIAAGYAKMPPEAQAWVLLIAPRGVAAFEPILEIARATTSGDVRAAYLFSFCIALDDAQLAAAARSDDPFARLAGVVFRDRVAREVVRGDERMRGVEANAHVGARDRIESEEDKAPPQQQDSPPPAERPTRSPPTIP
ncbi:MAG: hypothetical protein EXS01_06835 [Phycisphaerales bacterium]|nr:hypothetical protein [Phycisphaerales bacterium]